MEISKEFRCLVSKLIIQKKDELSQEQSLRMKKILEGAAKKGFDIPPGYVYGEFDDLQRESIRRRRDIVWNSLEQTLEAFDPPFYPELATQLYSLVEGFFPLSLCKPQDYLQRAGWLRPMDERVNQNLRSRLENERISSLSIVKTNIDLYVVKKRPKFNGGEPLDLEFQNKGDSFGCHVSEDKEDFVSSLSIASNHKNDNVVIDQMICPRSLLIDFAKLVLKQYPNATTADLRRNCFEDMKGLNSRDSLKINNLLVKAGARKSKKGEHAKAIEWKTKYSKAQWERVFDEK